MTRKREGERVSVQPNNKLEMLCKTCCTCALQANFFFLYNTIGSDIVAFTLGLLSDQTGTIVTGYDLHIERLQLANVK